MDKFANVNTLIGKLSFDEGKLVDNGNVLIESLVKARPKSLKGTYVKSAHISCTMGPGIKLDLAKYLKEKEAEE
jgi:large subunit ribosomal protein L1